MKRKRKIYESIYFTTYWDRCRKYIYAVRGYTCEECGKLLGKGEYNVHHIITLDENNYQDSEIVYGENNLKLLCINCHNEVHGRSTNLLRQDIEIDKETGEIREKHPPVI